MSNRLASSTSRSGMAMVYTAVALALLVGFCSFAVDYGRVQTAKTELEQVAAGAARAGAEGYVTSVNSAQTNASAVGTASIADGSSVTITSASDITFGNWNTATQAFTTLTGALQSTGNAVQVACGRTGAKGNQIPTLFAAGMGRGGCDVNGVATAMFVAGFPLYGNTSVSLAGSAYTDSYNSNIAAYSAGSANSFGSVGCNSNITLTGSSQIKGDARYGTAGSVSVGGSSSVTGVQAKINSTITFPAVVVPGTAYNYGYFAASSGTTYVPGGTYLLSGAAISGTAQMVCLGPVVAYTTGDFAITGSASITSYSNLPGNFELIVSGNHNITLSTTAATYVDLYNPLGNNTFTGAGEIYGRCTGNNISLTGAGTCGFHYDENLGRTNNGGCNTGGIIVRVVK